MRPGSGHGDGYFTRLPTFDSDDAPWDVTAADLDADGIDDYEIYEGSLGIFDSHTMRFCSTSGAATLTFAPDAGDTYYLVVPRNATREGSYGLDSDDFERPQGIEACLMQEVASCPSE